MNVVLADSGGANTGSIRYALQRLGVEAPVSADPAVLRAAAHVILPGVGAAAAAMARLQSLHLVDVLRTLTQPVLGICLGMQLLCRHSDEGDVEGLGVIDADVRKLGAAPGLRYPHMGWNEVRARTPHPLFAGAAHDGWAYFVHGYAVPACDFTLATCDYGGDFSAAIGRGNFMGVQFHPERSSAFGLALLQDFLRL
ncbi:MAG TPA: imidazole glycerol phosphate synthase subunit HisH [Rhodanobacteraceae bacterium]